ncbi:MAG: hypothetical protein EA355_11925 [Rhodobacteraceae bacterium]|nr:MAG: hypothetical protein EA355_11925 [Paracoccaceae bacterium]
MTAHGYVAVCQGPSANESPFGRLFRREDPLYDSHAVALLAGSQGPMMPPVAAAAASKPALPAGFTFFGQFVDHDLTEFRAVEGMRALPMNPELGVRQVVAPDPNVTAANGRTAHFDLDSVYGLLGQPEEALFNSRGLFRLGFARRTVGNTMAARDIRRATNFRDGRMIADPRNDENKLILQIHTLFMRLHNVTHRAKGGTHPVGSPVFQQTCAQVKAAYRRIVMMDYLPRLVRLSEIVPVIRRLRAGTAFFSDMVRAVAAAGACPPGALPMPVEFAQACFRLGHSQLRDGYEMKPGIGRGLFRAGGGDLRGREAIDGETEVDWALFFGPAAQSGEPLDATLPASVFRLPPPAVDAPPISLAERNIRRGADFGVASGQTAAVALKARYGHIAAPMTPDELGIGAEVLGVDPSLATQTPLWFYILREAAVRNPDGPQLGEVGGLIVAETILGALMASGVDIRAAADAAPDDAPPAATPTIETVDTMAGLLRMLGEV